MKNLVDILNETVQSAENIETNVMEILHNLSEIIESNIGRDESRLSAYKEELGDFIEGLKNGYNQTKQEIVDEFRSYGIDESSAYGYGHSTGYNTKNRIEQCKNKNIDVEARSFDNFYEQLSNVASNLKFELEELKTAFDNPYSFLVGKFPENRWADPNICPGLKKISILYKDLIDNVGRGTLGQNFIRQIEGKEELTAEDNMQLGIVYLLHGNFGRAQSNFNQAKDKTNDNDLRANLLSVYNNIGIVDRIVQSAYSKIKKAQEFERAEIVSISQV